MFEIKTFVNHFPYLGVFALLVLGGAGLPFPEDTTLILSGFLTAHDIIKPLPGFLVIYAGLLVSDYFLFWVGKTYGRRIVEHKKFQKLISHEKLLTLEEKFKKWGVLVILFGRHLLGLRAQIFLVAGVMRMHPIKFLIADACTALFTIALMGGIGYMGGNSLRVLKKDSTRIEHIAILTFVILLAVWMGYRYIKMKREFKSLNIDADDPRSTSDVKGQRMNE
jgi:membrane protein DedA with SNARE-associated domain